ncbi:hypothetical protein [Leucobacter sp. G161]|uniref:hypothetical protein n=1 Tax=Leucobacter sp. G161 TaxID=663704 RepID=UPI00073B872B|nr:hypothetical protein AUL38_05050 [Leucobacter sp. G161]
MSAHPGDQPWLVVIDPQTIFADPSSEWGSPLSTSCPRPVSSLSARRSTCRRSANGVPNSKR